MPRKKKQEVPVLYVVDERLDPSKPLLQSTSFVGGVYTDKEELIEAIRDDEKHAETLPVVYKLVPVKYQVNVAIDVEIED